jgi:hypothetical protein
MPDRKYDYVVSHPRKCECCKKLFFWEYDAKLVAADLHYQCPRCRKKRRKAA